MTELSRRRRVAYALLETAVLWAFVERVLLAMRTPAMVAEDAAFWRWHRETMWGKFCYEVVSGYGRGEVDHWYEDRPPGQRA